jgi:hypothetical protein
LSQPELPEVRCWQHAGDLDAHLGIAQVVEGEHVGIGGEFIEKA